MPASAFNEIAALVVIRGRRGLSPSARRGGQPREVGAPGALGVAQRAAVRTPLERVARARRRRGRLEAAATAVLALLAREQVDDRPAEQVRVAQARAGTPGGGPSRRRRAIAGRAWRGLPLKNCGGAHARASAHAQPRGRRAAAGSLARRRAARTARRARAAASRATPRRSTRAPRSTRGASTWIVSRPAPARRGSAATRAPSAAHDDGQQRLGGVELRGRPVQHDGDLVARAAPGTARRAAPACPRAAAARSRAPRRPRSSCRAAKCSDASRPRLTARGR